MKNQGKNPPPACILAQLFCSVQDPAEVSSDHAGLALDSLSPRCSESPSSMQKSSPRLTIDLKKTANLGAPISINCRMVPRTGGGGGAGTQGPSRRAVKRRPSFLAHFFIGERRIKRGMNAHFRCPSLRQKTTFIFLGEPFVSSGSLRATNTFAPFSSLTSAESRK